MIRSRHFKAARSGQSGFTLIELVVALGVTVVVMLGVLSLFDFSNKLTRVQTNVADMQQSLRIAQYDMVRLARMAGRGGLNVVQGVTITRDVEEGAHLIEDDDDSPRLLAGTDVLTLRGVFSTPIFQVSFTDPRSLEYPAPFSATGGFVEICNLSPSGKEQDLDSVKDLIKHSQALILVSPLDDQFYIVVSLDPTKTSLDEPTEGCTEGPAPGGLRIAFETVSSYSSLSAPPANAQLALEKVAYVGFLEEYRFYVREEVTQMSPVLSRARFFPVIDKAYGDNEDDRSANLRQDIADGIVDLQIAQGFDADGDGRIVEDLLAPDADEWFGNDADDAAASGDFKGLRISTLVRTRRADNTFEAEVMPGLEDHAYTEEEEDRINGKIARKYRRRMLQTIVNLRNLTT